TLDLFYPHVCICGGKVIACHEYIRAVLNQIQWKLTHFFINRILSRKFCFSIDFTRKFTRESSKIVLVCFCFFFQFRYQRRRLKYLRTRLLDGKSAYFSRVVEQFDHLESTVTKLHVFLSDIQLFVQHQK